MIKREEAERSINLMTLHLNGGLSEDDVYELIQSVYDSIGSCDECEHYGCEIGHINKDIKYCSDFERKEND